MKRISRWGVLVGAGLLVAAMFGLAQTKSKGHRGRSAGFKAVHGAAGAKSNAAATITSADGSAIPLPDGLRICARSHRWTFRKAEPRPAIPGARQVLD